MMNAMVPLKVCALLKAALLSEKTFSHVFTLKLGIAGCQASPIGCILDPLMYNDS